MLLRCSRDVRAMSTMISTIMFAEVYYISAGHLRGLHGPRETAAIFATRLIPRRGKLLDFAVHRAPRSLHRVDSRREPSERRDQPPHSHARLASDCSIHVHLWIRNVNQPLCIHKTSPWVNHP